MSVDNPNGAPRPTRGAPLTTAILCLGGIVVLGVGALGLYGMPHPAGKNAEKSAMAHAGACAKSLDAAQAIDPLVHGEVAALTVASQPNALGMVAFDDDQGRKTTIASFAGKPVLLNLWATWCVPCRAEMPSLDKLQASLGGPDFTVVPVNIDTVRLDRPKAFLKEIGATTLPFYSDRTADILQSLKQGDKVIGLPTTVLIGADGCEIATMAGPAAWDSPDAKALIEKVKATSKGA